MTARPDRKNLNSPTTNARAELTLQFGRGASIAPVLRQQIQRLVRASMQCEMALSIRFTNAREARTLNRLYRDGQYTPNVLTFEYWPEPAADIVICTGQVRREARQQGKTFARHLSHIVVHGALHAQGFDHIEPRQARHMEGLERMILARFGVPDPY